MLTCRMKDCVRESEIRGYCKTCYNRLWRSGRLPDSGEEQAEPVETAWKPRPESEKKKHSANAICTSYAAHLRNYQVCFSAEQRIYWKGKMRECLREAEEIGLTEEDLRQAVEENEMLESLKEDE